MDPESRVRNQESEICPGCSSKVVKSVPRVLLTSAAAAVAAAAAAAAASKNFIKCRGQLDCLKNGNNYVTSTTKNGSGAVASAYPD